MAKQIAVTVEMALSHDSDNGTPDDVSIERWNDDITFTIDRRREITFSFAQLQQAMRIFSQTETEEKE